MQPLGACDAGLRHFDMSKWPDDHYTQSVPAFIHITAHCLVVAGVLAELWADRPSSRTYIHKHGADALVYGLIEGAGSHTECMNSTT